MNTILFPYICIFAIFLKVTLFSAAAPSPDCMLHGLEMHRSQLQVLFCMASAVASSQAEATRPRYYPLSLLVDTPRRQQSQSLLDQLHGCSTAGPACVSGRPLSHLPGHHEQIQWVERSGLRIGVFKTESSQFLKGC